MARHRFHLGDRIIAGAAVYHHHFAELLTLLCEAIKTGLNPFAFVEGGDNHRNLPCQLWIAYCQGFKWGTPPWRG